MYSGVAVRSAFACMGLNPSTRTFCITTQAKRALAESDAKIIALVHRVKGKHQLLFCLSVAVKKLCFVKRQESTVCCFCAQT